MNVLVTGALGYIGSAVAVELRDAGHAVIGLDNATSNRLRDIDGVDVWQCSVTARVVSTLVGRADAVIHLAAYPGIGNCAKQPLTATDANIEGTINVVEACVEHATPLIFGSTIGVYGDVDRIDGTQQRSAPTFYAQTKRAGEDVIAAVAHQQFLPAVTFQMANLYGAHDVDGHTVSKPTVVNRFLGLAAAGDPLTVHEPGEQTRDFIHVADVARAYRLAVEKLSGVSGMLRLPLASGKLHSVEEVAEWVADLTGASIEYVSHPGDPRWVAPIDVSRTRGFLEWAPRHTVRDYIEGEVHV